MTDAEVQALVDDFADAVERQYAAGGTKAMIAASLSIVRATAVLLPASKVVDYCEELLQAFADGATDSGSGLFSALFSEGLH